MTGFLGLSTISLWPALIGAGGLAIAAGAGVHYLDSQIYGDQIAGLKLTAAQNSANDYKAALDQFAADSVRVHDAASLFQAQQVNLQAQFTSIKASFDAAIKAKALPPDCKPDDERLRVLAAAISAANAAHPPAGPGAQRAVPRPGSPSNQHLR